MTAIRGRIKLLAPTDVTDLTKTIAARVGTAGPWSLADLAVTGDLYPFFDLLYVNHESLYQRVASAFLAALGGGTMLVEAQPPLSNQDASAARVDFVWDGGVWEIDLAQFTLDARGIGGKTTDGVLTSDGTGRLSMPWTSRGAWFSVNLFKGEPAFLDKDTINDVDFSSSRRWEAKRQCWAPEDVRIIDIRAVPKGRIYEEVTTDPYFAGLAYLAVGDDHATIRPVIDALLAKKDVLAVYNMADGGVIDVPGVEVLQLFEDEYLEYPKDFASNAGITGEYFTVELALRVEPS